MAPSHGSLAGVLVNGYDLSPFLNSLSESTQIDTAEETCFGPLGTPVTAKSYVPGQETATLDAAGKYVIDHALGAPNQDQVADVLEAAIRGPKDLLTYVPYGDGFGNVCIGMSADETKYEVTSPVSSIVAVTTAFQSSSGAELMNVLHALTAEAAGTILGTDLDAGAGYDATKWKGVVAYLHVTAITGAPNLACKIQHSTDGVTWVDLATFTNVTAQHKAQRITFSGTVNRHLRAQAVVAAGATATFHIAAGRIPA